MNTVDRLRSEAEAFPRGSLDWQYRRRAAWKITQLRDGIPSCDWTEAPTDFWAEKETA